MKFASVWCQTGWWITNDAHQTLQALVTRSLKKALVTSQSARNSPKNWGLKWAYPNGPKKGWWFGLIRIAAQPRRRNHRPNREEIRTKKGRSSRVGKKRESQRAAKQTWSRRSLRRRRLSRRWRRRPETPWILTNWVINYFLIRLLPPKEHPLPPKKMCLQFAPDCWFVPCPSVLKQCLWFASFERRRDRLLRGARVLRPRPGWHQRAVGEQAEERPHIRRRTQLPRVFHYPVLRLWEVINFSFDIVLAQAESLGL
jgi:hypothetical protein